MGRRRLLPACLAIGAAAFAVLATGRVAWAQTSMSAPPGPMAAQPFLTGPGSPRLTVVRPRFVAAVGMGVSFDSAGYGDAGAQPTPAFFGSGGIGDGFLGFDFLGYASSGSGRSTAHDPIDRLGLDLYGVVRPAAELAPEDDRYRYRVLRTVGAELGLGLERAGRTTSAGTRFVVHTGVRVELPITPPGVGGELRIRLGVRRDFGLYTPQIYGATAADVTRVRDTFAEVYTSLVLVF
jgi:hypothetical protein